MKHVVGGVPARRNEVEHLGKARLVLAQYVDAGSGVGPPALQLGQVGNSLIYLNIGNERLGTCVADPDPYVFGPPGSIHQRHGSESFYHQAKIVKKTLITTNLLLF